MKLEPTIAERWNNRAIFALLWPLILEQVLAVSMGAADTFMISPVGEFAVSAVNIVDNISNLLIIAFMALSTGGAVIVSQYIGRRDYEKSSLAAKQLVYSVFAISIFITIFTVLFRRPVIGIIYGNIELDVMDAASIYLMVTGFSYPFLGINNANNALFRASGDSRTPMLIALIANVLKIALNAVFIFVLNMGIMGAALSTLICRFIAAFITTVLLYKKHSSPISLAGMFRVKIVRSMIKNILNVGLPSGIDSTMFMFGRLMTQRIFTYFGTAAIAANAIASVVNSISFMPGMAFAMTLMTITGQCVGAGDYATARKLVKKIMTMAYISMVLMSVIILALLEPLVSLFNLSPQSAEMAIAFLRIHCIFMAIGWAMSFALPNALRASGDVRYVMLCSVISMWTVRVSAAYLITFVLGVGPQGVWLAMGADFMVRGTLFLSRWIGGKWQTKRVISD